MVREKSLWKFFHQLRAESRACTVTFPVTLGWMNLATTAKPLEHSQRVCVEVHTIFTTGTIVAIAFYVNGYGHFTVREVDYSIKNQPIRERVTTSNFYFHWFKILF